MKTFSIAVLLIAGAVSGWPKEWEIPRLDQIQTNQGLLRVEVAGMNGYRVSVGDVWIAELEARGVTISTMATAADSRQYVLLELSTGGGSCASLHRLVDLTPGRKPYLTREFGNCVSQPAIKTDSQKVTIEFSSSPEFRAQSYTYAPQRRRLSSGTYSR